MMILVRDDNIIILILLLSYLVHIVTPLTITSLSLSSYSEEGKTIYIHCAYSVNTDKMPELDIKWYLGSSPSPFMVFLPNLQKEPQVVDPRFREKIIFREGYMNSGFMMENVTADMSGVYTCKVSTNTEERSRWRRITIYSK